MRQHFGLHTDGDLVFLHQQGGGRCVTPGLEGLPAPWKVKRYDRIQCPHDLTPAPGKAPARRGLVKVLAPVPDGGVYWAPVAAMDNVAKAIVMSSPINQIVFPAWGVGIGTLVPQLSLTNIAPLIITDTYPRNLRAVTRLLRLPRVRTILFVGDLRPPEATPVDWTLPSVSDWKKAGAALLHQYVQQVVNKAKHYAPNKPPVVRPSVEGTTPPQGNEGTRG